MAGLIAKKAPPKAAKAMAPAEPIRFYRVLADRMVPRRGGGGGNPYLLKKGQEISSGSYFVKDLETAGVEIVEIPTPAWFIEQQAVSRERHQQMLDDGHDVGPVPPPYEPPALLRARQAAPASSTEASAPS